MTEPATVVNSVSYAAILWFGAAALSAPALIQAIRVLKGGQFSANFTRLYGLILVATFGAVLVVSEVSSEAKTGAFTLLGTIAGYLAGARSQPPVAGEEQAL